MWFSSNLVLLLHILVRTLKLISEKEKSQPWLPFGACEQLNLALRLMNHPLASSAVNSRMRKLIRLLEMSSQACYFVTILAWPRGQLWHKVGHFVSSRTQNSWTEIFFLFFPPSIVLQTWCYCCGMSYNGIYLANRNNSPFTYSQLCSPGR